VGVRGWTANVRGSLGGEARSDGVSFSSRTILHLGTAVFRSGFNHGIVEPVQQRLKIDLPLLDAHLRQQARPPGAVARPVAGETSVARADCDRARDLATIGSRGIRLAPEPAQKRTYAACTILRLFSLAGKAEAAKPNFVLIPTPKPQRDSKRFRHQRTMSASRK